jgi:hypothetical protein
MYCEFVFKCILCSILGYFSKVRILSRSPIQPCKWTIILQSHVARGVGYFLNHIIILRFPLAAYGWVSEGWKVIVRHKSVCERTCDPRDRICLNYNNSTRNAFCWIRSVKIKLNIRLVYYFSQVSSTSNTPSVRRRRPRGHRRSPNLLKLRTVCLFNL